MSCHDPYVARITPQNKIIFHSPRGFSDKTSQAILIRCGKCESCRMLDAAQWTTRCYLESQKYQKNLFITLTYSPRHIPADGQLDTNAVPALMKRLRKFIYEYYWDNQKRRYIKRPLSEIRGASARPSDKTTYVKYFHCGEYGAKRLRPHYHVCLFNFDFEDKYPYAWKNDYFRFKSPTLEYLWTDKQDKLNYPNIKEPVETYRKGICDIGHMNQFTIAYTARYILKKKNKDKRIKFRGLTPEFTSMSKGIGEDAFYKHYKNFYHLGYIRIEGRKYPIPRYYDKKLAKVDPMLYKLVKKERLQKIPVLSWDELMYDLKSKSIIIKQSVSKYVRSYEENDTDQ